MGSRVEILNEGSYRADGRHPTELRNVTIALSPHPHATGSATLTHGLTEVQATVFGPKEHRMRGNALHDRATLNVELAMAPWSGNDWRKRGRGDRRSQELAAAIKSTFEPVIQTALYPRSEICVYLQVFQQDGGVLQACINATTIALIDAGVAVSDYVCALTCGVHITTPLLDLSQNEESDLPSLTVAVMPRRGKVTLVLMETRLHVDRFQEVFKLASQGAKVIHNEMRRVVRERTWVLLESMTFTSAEGKRDDADDAEMRDDY